VDDASRLKHIAALLALKQNAPVMKPMTVDPTPTRAAGCTCASVPSAVLWVALVGRRRSQP
jgi:hypothetical protein